MAEFQVMTETGGDDRFQFDPSDAVGLAEAEKRFKELTGSGLFAYKKGKDGAPNELVRSFDPAAETTVFHRQLVGG